ncbi:hypothetical protein D3Z50_09500 [Clostridiaceae bacterium]|nr:hypothetical protein [Clostridiaceae bacterium]
MFCMEITDERIRKRFVPEFTKYLLEDIETIYIGPARRTKQPYLCSSLFTYHYAAYYILSYILYGQADLNLRIRLPHLCPAAAPAIRSGRVTSCSIFCC